jgi:hypothetical protein
MVSSDQMDDAKQLSYPIEAVTDLATNYSPDHFRFAVEQCRQVIAKIIVEHRSDSDQQIVRVRIIQYLDLQLSRASRWIEEETDVIAGVMRSLIELSFWADFISKSPENATQFLHESSIDARELYERLEKLDLWKGDLLELLPVKEKRITIKPSGLQESLLWKMCSKLIHPTSMVINDLDGTMHNDVQRRILAIYVVFYG